jgi:hypothetical protein
MYIITQEFNQNHSKWLQTNVDEQRNCFNANEALLNPKELTGKL